MFDEKILKEVYSFEGTNQSMVINQITQEVFLKKRLKVYNKDVYSYLINHPNLHIPKIYAVNENDGILTIYEEYLNGITLEELLSHDAIPEQQALDILYGILEGIDFLHSAEPPIIHRDLKPSNIMITNTGIVKIIDYDAAKLQNDHETKDTVLIGTQGFAAPEQYGFSASTVQTDIFAIGKIMEKLLPDTKFYSRIIMKATAMNPDDRFKSAKELGKSIYGNFGKNHKEHNKKNLFSRILDHLPGFRSRKLWKAMIALFCDFLWLYFIIAWDNYETQAANNIVKIFFVFMYLTVIDICFDVSGIFSKLPGKNSKNSFINVLSRILWSALFFMILVVTMVIIMNIFHLA